MYAMKSAIVMLALSIASPLLADEASPAPSAETLALGRQVASHGTLATLIPLLSKKESAELIEKHPDLTDADKEKLRTIADAEAQANLTKLIDAQAAIYAKEMSLADLQALAAFTGSDAARKQSALQPALIMGSMTVLDGVDFKKDVMVKLCKQTGKGCEKAE